MACRIPSAIASMVCTIGEKKADLTWNRTIVLGFLAGAYIAFGGFLAIIAAAGNPWPKELLGLQRLVFGAVFPVGLMLVVIGGAELFTGNCLLPTVACLDNRGNWSSLARNWIGSYMGNFIGGVFVAYVLGVGTGLLLKDPWMSYITQIARAKCELSFIQAFLRGVGCNWLVCLAIWLASATDNLVGKIFAIQFPIMAFVTLGFEHSVANMFFVPAGMFVAHEITWTTFLYSNLLPVTMGNIIGGTFFVSMLYYYLYNKEMERWPRLLALVGIGRLGEILLNHLGSQRSGFHIEAGFGMNPNEIGRTVASAKIYRPEQIAKIIRKNRIRIGMITASAKEAQQAADLLVISGIKGILNLSGSRVIVPSGVETKDIDLGSRPEAALS